MPYVVAAVRDISAYPRVKQALQRARYSEFVAQMGRLAVDARDVEALLKQVPAVAAEALQVESAVLFLLEGNGLEFRVAGGVGFMPHETPGTRIPNRPDTPPGFVLAQGQPVIVEDFREERRFEVPAAYLEQGLVSTLAVPLSDRGRTVGMLSVRSHQARRFGDDEVRFLESLANLLAASLQRTQSEEALSHAQRLESVGQLTGGVAHDFNNLLTAIALYSSLGVGTTVTLYIPAVADKEAGSADVNALSPAVLPGLRVLVVEDEPEVREVVRNFLVSFGCSVTLRASAEDGLRKLADGDFDLPLSDDALGAGMRGSELARQAKERWPGLAILLMSGFSAEMLEPATPRI